MFQFILHLAFNQKQSTGRLYGSNAYHHFHIKLNMFVLYVYNTQDVYLNSGE